MKFFIPVLLYLLTLMSTRQMEEPERQISSANVLLPVPQCDTCRRVSYTLTARGGCYSWEISNSEVLEMTQHRDSSEEYGCFSKAIVTPKTQSAVSSPIWIIARDRQTSSILRCEAHIQLIDHLQIIRQQRKIDVDDVEALQVQAFDDDDNLFSSLEGLHFAWNIMDTASLEHATFKESNIENTPKRKSIEARGKHSDIFLVRGKETGEARVEVDIEEEKYENVKKAQVTLQVVKPFEFDPPRAIYILPHQRFKFGLNHLKKEQVSNIHRTSKVTLPSSQYDWKSLHEGVATTDQSGEIIAQNVVEVAKIRVNDTRARKHFIENTVNVVAPRKIIIKMKDVTQEFTESSTDQRKFSTELLLTQLGSDYWSDNQLYSISKKSWNLVEGHLYHVQLELYADAHHLIESCSNIRLNFKHTRGYFAELAHRTEKQNFILRALRPSAEEEISFVASFDENFYFQNLGHEINSNDRYQFGTLQTRVPIDIYRPVHINHFEPKVNLPLLNYFTHLNGDSPSQVWNFLRRNGGSGEYAWKSSDQGTVSVEMAGLVRGHKLGNAVVTARDALNSHNYDKIEVEVSRVDNLSWMQAKLEVLHGNYDYLTLIARDNRQRLFTNCTSLYTDWGTISEHGNELTGKGDEVINLLTDDYDLNQMREVPTMYEEVSRFVRLEKQNLIASHYSLTTANREGMQAQPLEQTTLLDINYGICLRRHFRGQSLGLRRVRAYLPSSNPVADKISSFHAEVRVYEQPQTVGPSHSKYLSQLHEKSFPMRDLIANKMVDGDYYVAYGSTLHWNIKGGPTQWSDIPSSFYTHFSITDLATNREENERVSANGELVMPNTPQFGAALTCNGILDQQKRYEVALSFGNSVGQTLLRPAKVQVALILNCAIAKSLVMGWVPQWKPNGNKPVLPRKIEASQDQVPTFRVSEGSELLLRGVLLDRDDHMFYNFSSIAYRVESKANELGKIERLQNNLIEQIHQDVYFLHRTLIFNEPGVFEIEGDATAYYTDYEHEKTGKGVGVRDRIRVIVVKRLQIYPPFQVIYYHEKNYAELQIIHGSGHFEVATNDTQVAQVYKDDRNPSRLRVVPFQSGPVTVVVNDTGLLGEVEVTQVKADILFSDIFVLNLQGGGHIELGKETGALVTPLDINGNPFNETHYQFMNIELEVDDSSSTQLALDFELIDRARLLYKISTLATGNHAVVAKAQRKSKYSMGRNEAVSDVVNAVMSTATSKPIHVSVFPRVKLLPERLLLIPGGEYTLRIVGGPPQGLWKPVFEMDNSEIAEINELGVVRGRRVGLTGVVMRMGYGQPREQIELTEENRLRFRDLETGKLMRSVSIEIALATGLQLPALTGRNLKLDSVVRPVIELKRDMDTFNFQTGPLYYGWRITPPTSLQPWKRMIQPENREQDMIGAHFEALTPGTADVTAYVDINYPEPYESHRPNQLYTSVNIGIDKRPQVYHPEYAEKEDGLSRLYLLPPNTFHQLEVHNVYNGKYSLMTPACQTAVACDNPAITLHDNGKIQAHQKFGKATVVIDEHTGDETRVNLRVAAIHAILVERTYTLGNMAIGGETDIKVTYQDMVGRSFARKVEGLAVGIELSHPHILSAKMDFYNSTITLRGLQKGLCNVIVFLKENENVRDVFQVKVSMAMEPAGPIYMSLMGTQQMKVTEPTRYGKWVADNPNIVDINESTGLIKAKSEGVTRIHYKDPTTNLDISQEVNVGRVGDLVQTGPAPSYITNYKNDKNYQPTYELSFTISNTHNLIGERMQDFRFICEVPKDLTPWVQVYSHGDMNCKIKPLKPLRNEEVTEIPPSQIVLTAKLEAGNIAIQTTVRLPFRAEFELITQEEGKLKLYSDLRERRVDIAFVNPNDIFVRSLDQKRVQVRQNRYLDHNGKMAVYVRVRTNQDIKPASLIQIENVLTHQVEPLTIEYRHSQIAPSKAPLQINGNKDSSKNRSTSAAPRLNMFQIIALIVIFILVLVIIWVCMSGSSAPHDPYFNRPQPRYGGSSRLYNHFSKRRQQLDKPEGAGRGQYRM